MTEGLLSLTIFLAITGTAMVLYAFRLIKKYITGIVWYTILYHEQYIIYSGYIFHLH